ncbi:uncharacterized protein [Antedon mediterranea]|uniref:uncharacterized protein isoform X2 n=1 Tax=Antedon mediterranea TaxID=105859 RepID=UPI003AF81DD4
METFSLNRPYSTIAVLILTVYIATASTTGLTHLRLDKRGSNGPRVQVCQCGSMGLQKCMKVFLPACCIQHSSLGSSVVCAPMGKKSMDEELFLEQSSQYEDNMNIYKKFNFIKNLLSSNELLNADTIPHLLQDDSSEDRF